MLHFLVLLQEAEGFLAKATVETSIGMHLHLQDHNRQRFGAAGLMERPDHPIGVVAKTHQIGQGPEHLRVQVIAWHRGGEGR